MHIFTKIVMSGAIAAALFTGPGIGLLPAALAQEAAPGLPSRLQVVVSGHKLPADSYGFLVQEAQSGATVLDINSATPLNPASTMKLLTTLAALEQLGPAFNWHTNLYALGPVHDGTLAGDLLVRGGGDPYLLEDQVRNMLKALQRQGITRISGDLVLDTSYFDAGVTEDQLIDNQEDRAYNVLPNALMSNFQAVTFYFRPAADGKHVEVSADPALGNLQITNNLTLKNAPCDGYQRGIRFDDDAANRIAVATEKFGDGMDNNVCAMLERLDQIGSCQRIIDDQRHAGLFGDCGDGCDIGDDTAGIGDGFDEDRLGLRGNRGLEGGEIIGISPFHAPVEILVGMIELVDRAAIEFFRGDELVARLQQGVEDQKFGRMARGDGKRRCAAFKRRDATFENRIGRVGDAGVDIAERLQSEEGGGMIDIVEHERRGLINRCDAGAGCRIRRGPCMNGKGGKAGLGWSCHRKPLSETGTDIAELSFFL